MKTSIKAISVFMSAMLSFGSLGAMSLTAGAEQLGDTAKNLTSGDFVYILKDNTATITNYTGSATALSIPSTIDGYKVTAVGDYAFSKKTKLTNVFVPSSVVRIDSSAFAESTNLKKVTLPDNVEEIGVSAFYGCKKLTSVNIPKKLSAVNEYTFSGCTGLTEITMSDSVEAIGANAFENCSSLKTVNLSENTTVIGDEAFSSCSSLYNINLENVDQIGVGSFAYCTELGSVDISGCDYIDEYAFFDCESLNDITFSDFIDSIPQTAFQYTLWEMNAPDGVLYAGNLAYKIIGDFTDDTLKIKEGTYAINNSFLCYNDYVKKIELPDYLINIGESAFEGCTALKSISIPYGCIVSEYAFYGCSDLSNIYFDDESVLTMPTSFEETAWFNSQPDGIVYHGKSACGYKGDFKSEEVIKDGTIVISDGLFYGDEELVSISIPDSVQYMGESLFAECVNLKNVTMPRKIDFINNELFYGCESLENIYIPNVQFIGESAFAHCTALKSVVFPDSGNLFIGNAAFLNCTSLKKVVVEGDSLMQIGGAAFMNCTSLESINLPKSVEYIGENAFEFCDILRISCYENSYAHIYAEENGIDYAIFSETRMVGDINNDGKIDVNDVTDLQKHIAGITKENGEPIVSDDDTYYADISNDGIIDSRDVTSLQILLSN